MVAPCSRCGHGADRHLLEGRGADVEVADKIRGDAPRAALGPFVCGVDGCACPDYVDEPLSKRRKQK